MMNKSWWRSKSELDDDQIAFIKLPAKGRYSLIGPPGSGKTNLLLLRAQFIAGTGEKNVLIITYTKALADFIRTGIGETGLILPDQVKTYHSWACSHILEHLGQRALPNETDFDDSARDGIVSLVREANLKLPSKKLFSAIFVDEAQDLSADELEALLCLSDKVAICGDENQGIYRRDGLAIIDKLELQPHSLKRHFRIGQRIARVADRLIPPEREEDSLEAMSNYDLKSQGESSANLYPCETRDKQFTLMFEKIKIQLDAFKDEGIGIFCGKRDTLEELRSRFNETDLAEQVCVHGIDDDASFSGNCMIHVMTMHAAKGTEFRAVHLFGIEELAKYPLNRSRLAYTAITRAKTALNAFRTGSTSNGLENAFAEPRHMELDDLFPGDKT